MAKARKRKADAMIVERCIAAYGVLLLLLSLAISIGFERGRGCFSVARLVERLL